MIEVLADLPEQIAAVADRWKKQYCHRGEWLKVSDGSSFQIYEKLCALTKESNREDVARIIGNDSWIGYICNACGDKVNSAIQVGEPPDHESATATLCRDCAIKVGKAAKAMKA